VLRARAFREKHPRFETVPRDDRSSKNQPKRVEAAERGAFEVGNFAPFSRPAQHARGPPEAHDAHELEDAHGPRAPRAAVGPVEAQKE